MNVTITIRESDVRGMINRTFGPGVRKQILSVMGAKLIAISRRNFGASGPDRPLEWAPLSKEYARRVKRPYATLYLSGDLYRSARLSVTDDAATVSFGGGDVPYASYHQQGTRKMPPRPFIPLWGNQLSPTAQRQVVTAGQLELQRILRNNRSPANY